MMSKTKKNQKKQEILGSFNVIGEDFKTKKVVVCQEIIKYYNGAINHTKKFFLDSENGKEIFPTQNPNVLSLDDGTLFRKKGA